MSDLSERKLHRSVRNHGEKKEMKNKEKFEKELVEMAVNSDTFSVSQDGNIKRCSQSQCKNCIFYPGAGRCCDKRKEWAESEYVEPKVFTEEEKAFIRACDKIKYVTRDKNGTLIGFFTKPFKGDYKWMMNIPDSVVLIQNCCTCK